MSTPRRAPHCQKGSNAGRRKLLNVYPHNFYPPHYVFDIITSVTKDQAGMSLQ